MCTNHAVSQIFLNRMISAEVHIWHRPFHFLLNIEPDTDSCCSVSDTALLLAQIDKTVQEGLCIEG